MKYKTSIEQLKRKGWVTFSKSINIDTLKKSVELETNFKYKLNRNIISPNKKSAYRVTLSKVYGLESYPLHTDGVQYLLPPRFILLKKISIQKNKTKTYLLDSTKLSKDNRELFNNKTFKIKGNGFTEVTPLVNKKKILRENIFRYNPLIMKATFRKSEETLNKIFSESKKDVVDWEGVEVLLIDNWRTLHSRGAIIDPTSERILERVEFHLNIDNYGTRV